MTKAETKKALDTLNEITIKEQGLSFVKLLHQWHKGNSMFATDIERIVCKAMLAHKSQLKPQERVLNLCNDIGCNGHVKLRKTCEKCGRSVAFNPLK